MIHSKKMKFAVTTAAATAIVCTGALAANVTSTTDVNVRSGAGNSYSVLTVISRLMLCSRDISVSVETTPGMVCNWLLSKSMSCSLSCA